MLLTSIIYIFWLSVGGLAEIGSAGWCGVNCGVYVSSLFVQSKDAVSWDEGFFAFLFLCKYRFILMAVDIHSFIHLYSILWTIYSLYSIPPPFVHSWCSPVKHFAIVFGDVMMMFLLYTYPRINDVCYGFNTSLY